ncbi:MAG TPA: NAD-binding protein, partial [Thalassospira sp.]|nr:NAD-binding protein [Thalassospira sp.]
MGVTKRKINWGILSTAKIGLEKVIPAIQKSSSSNVLGIASRNAGRSARAANDLGIQKSYASYEALIADPEIDAIYNPLPNHMHVDWTLAAARAGKHVLCEKPIGLNTDDARRLLQCPDNVLIAEAFMVRYHPQWLRVRDLVRSGELGEVRAIQAAFSYFNTDGSDIRNRPDAGGGAMMDIGCYPITAGRFLFENEPVQVMALIDRDPEFKTDRMASVVADFGRGRQLSFVVSTQLCPYQT